MVTSEHYVDNSVFRKEVIIFGFNLPLELIK